VLTSGTLPLRVLEGRVGSLSGVSKVGFVPQLLSKMVSPCILYQFVKSV